MCSMWEVHQLVTEHHDGLVRAADRERLRDELRAAQSQGRERRAAGNRWGRLIALLDQWYPRRPAAARH